MITSLELSNWRSHSDTRLQFGKGTNLIVGIMGSGKSAVLDGICYALYGTFPALRRRSVATEDLIRHGGKEAGVALEIVHSGKKYRIARALRKGEHGKMEASAKIFEDGKLLDSGQARVSELVAERLGVDYELFNRAIYSDQNNIGYFLELDAGRRKKEMDGLMGLDRFEDVRANAVRVMNRIEGERKLLVGRYDEKRHAALGKEMEEKRGRLGKEEEEGREAEEEMKAAAGEAEAAEKGLAVMRKDKARKDELGRALDKERGKMEALRSELAGKEVRGDALRRKKELGDAGAELERVSSLISNAEKANNAVAREVGALGARLREAERAERERKTAEEALKRALGGKDAKGLEARMNAAEAEIMELSSNAKALLQGATEMEKYIDAIEDNCPVCGTELGHGKAEHIRGERERAIAEKKKGAASAQKRVAELGKEAADIRRALCDAEDARRRIAAPACEPAGKLAAMLAEAKGKAEAAEREIAKLGDARKAAEKGHREAAIAAREAEALEAKAKSLDALGKRVAELEKEHLSVQFSEQEYAKCDGRAREILLRRERAAGKWREAGRVIASLNEMLGALRRELEWMEGARKEIEAKGAMLAQLALFRNAVVEAQAELRAELVEAINAAMNGIWPVLYPYADYRQLRIAAGEEDYSFEVYDGEWRKLEKVGSGGERACLALTLRIALATVLAPEAGWLVLDEPTHNLDRGAVQALAEALENKVPELVEQAFVISHEESLMNSEFARSYRFTRDKGGGGATAAEEL
jgi:exonuclease SbcC